MKEYIIVMGISFIMGLYFGFKSGIAFLFKKIAGWAINRGMNLQATENTLEEIRNTKPINFNQSVEEYKNQTS